jgi:cytoskeletal protein CcmA (bactofilin family)
MCTLRPFKRRKGSGVEKSPKILNNSDMKHILLGALLLAVFPSQVLYAQTVVRTGDAVSVASDKIISGDFYTATSILDISGEVAGDISAVTGQATLNGVVGGDVLVIAGNADIHATIGDDLRIIGGEVVIASPVAGDVFVIGGTVRFLSTATVGGDVLVYGGDVEIASAVGGDILGTVNALRIDAVVAGSVNVTTASLVLGDSADIAGTVQYVSVNALTRAPDAKIGGEITRNDPLVEETNNSLQAALIPALVLLFSVLVWYMVARTFLQKIVDRALVRSARPGLLGFLAFLIVPLIIVVLLVSMLGTLVGLTALSAYFLMVCLGIVSGAAVLGQLIMKLKKGNTNTISPLSLTLGVIGITVCALVPFVGGVVLLALLLVTVGAIVDIVIRPNLQ